MAGLLEILPAEFQAGDDRVDDPAGVYSRAGSRLAAAWRNE